MFTNESVFAIDTFSEQLLSEHEASAWATDIAYFQEQLEVRHLNLYHTVSESTFVSSLERLKNSLHTLTRNQVVVEMLRITSSVKDGHTQFQFWHKSHPRFPLGFEYIEGHWRVVKSTDALRHLLGLKLVAINDRHIHDIEPLLGELLPVVENKYSTVERMSWFLTLSSVLQGAGIISSTREADFQFLSDGDKSVLARLTSVDTSEFDRLVSATLPTFTQLQRKSDDNLHIRSLDGQAIRIFHDKSLSTSYIRFDSYPNFDETVSFMEKQAKLMTRFEIKNLIIDLRANGGGDFFVGLGLAYPLVLLDDIDWLNGVYVLTDATTFSAAMSNTAHYKQILNAKIIGSPSGARPVGYQDADIFVLPNSKIPIMYSKRFYRFQNRKSDAIFPDVTVNQNWRDRFNGVDTVYQWVINDIRHRLERNR